MSHILNEIFNCSVCVWVCVRVCNVHISLYVSLLMSLCVWVSVWQPTGSWLSPAHHNLTKGTDGFLWECSQLRLPCFSPAPAPPTTPIPTATPSATASCAWLLQFHQSTWSFFYSKEHPWESLLFLEMQGLKSKQYATTIKIELIIWVISNRI